MPADEYDSVLAIACAMHENETDNNMFNDSLDFSMQNSPDLFQVPSIPAVKQSITKEKRILICLA